jgi:hypothetical protein
VNLKEIMEKIMPTILLVVLVAICVHSQRATDERDMSFLTNGPSVAGAGMTNDPSMPRGAWATMAGAGKAVEEDDAELLQDLTSAGAKFTSDFGGEQKIGSFGNDFRQNRVNEDAAAKSNTDGYVPTYAELERALRLHSVTPRKTDWNGPVGGFKVGINYQEPFIGSHWDHALDELAYEAMQYPGMQPPIMPYPVPYPVGGMGMQHPGMYGGMGGMGMQHPGMYGGRAYAPPKTSDEFAPSIVPPQTSGPNFFLGEPRATITRSYSADGQIQDAASVSSIQVVTMVCGVLLVVMLILAFCMIKQVLDHNTEQIKSTIIQSASFAKN